MKLYRVHYRMDNGQSAGYSFFPNIKEARKSANEYPYGIAKDPTNAIGAYLDAIELTPNKHGIIAALNRYAGHPDNG